jgi:resuscitation-promoting factor RpfA
MPDNPAKDPAGEQKVGPGKDKKGGMLTGKNKWYVIGGLGIVAVLVFFFVSRSKNNAAAGTATTSGSSLDPSTQAALESALQSQASGGQGLQGEQGPAGATGPAGPTGPKGARGKTGKAGTPGTRGPRGKSPPERGGHTQFYNVKPGDTLSSIAGKFNVKGGWQQLYHDNRGVVGSNPNVVHPGQRLKV